MSDFRTNGYDIVLQYSAAQLTEYLHGEIAGFPNLRFETDFPDDFADTPVEFEISPAMGHSVDYYTTIGNGLRLTVFLSCQAFFPDGVLAFIARLEIRHPLTFRDPAARNLCLVLDFTDGIDPANIDVTLSNFFWNDDRIPPLPDDAAWAELFPEEAVWEAFVPVLAAAITSRLPEYLSEEVREIGHHCLCYNVDPAAYEEDYAVPVAVDYLVLESGPEIPDGALVVMITTRGGTPGDRSAFTAPTLGAYSPGNMLLMFGNDLVLRRIVCPALLRQWAFGDGEDFTVEDYFEFDEAGSASLTRNVSVDDWVEDPIDEADFTRLDLSFVDDRIEVSGWVETSGWGWTCGCSFSGSVSGDVGRDGVPRISASIDPGYADLRYEPWFHILTSLGLFMLLPFLSLIITTTVREIYRETTEALVLSIFRCVFPDFSETASFSIPCQSDIDAVVLDDVAVFCRSVAPEGETASTRPDVWIEGTLEVTDTGNPETTVRRHLGPVEVITTTFEKAHAGSFRANTRHLTAPLSYRWYLGERELDGTGHVTVDGSRVGFSINWHRCEITTELGVTLDTELTVVVEDGRGLVLEAVVGLVAAGSGSMRGVSGDDVVMGPVLDLFREDERRMIDEIMEAAAIPEWGTRPDEHDVGGTVHHNESVMAFRSALCRGMDIKDESELPPHPH